MVQGALHYTATGQEHLRRLSKLRSSPGDAGTRSSDGPEGKGPFDQDADGRGTGGTGAVKEHDDGLDYGNDKGAGNGGDCGDGSHQQSSGHTQHRNDAAVTQSSSNSTMATSSSRFTMTTSSSHPTFSSVSDNVTSVDDKVKSPSTQPVPTGAAFFDDWLEEINEEGCREREADQVSDSTLAAKVLDRMGYMRLQVSGEQLESIKGPSGETNKHVRNVMPNVS